MTGRDGKIQVFTSSGASRVAFFGLPERLPSAKNASCSGFPGSYPRSFARRRILYTSPLPMPVMAPISLIFRFVCSRRTTTAAL